MHTYSEVSHIYLVQPQQDLVHITGHPFETLEATPELIEALQSPLKHSQTPFALLISYFPLHTIHFFL
jgi:hypothetical protein